MANKLRWTLEHLPHDIFHITMTKKNHEDLKTLPRMKINYEGGMQISTF